MKKCGEPLTDYLKVPLECSICKGLVNSAVSRLCLHTFCSDCITHWINTSSSNDCPICRDGVIMHVKNPTIDKVVQMLVDATFTEKEREERSNEIHQLSPASPLRFQTSISNNQQGEAVLREIYPDTSILGRWTTCATIANSLFREIWAKFEPAINDDKDSISNILFELHFGMFIEDLESLPLVYGSISKFALQSSLFE